MRINGQWVGWGLGDWSHFDDGSDRDPTVRKIKNLMRAKFGSYAGNLADTNKFDIEMEVAVKEMQARYVANGKLIPGQFIFGVLDEPTQRVMGYLKSAPIGGKPKKFIFTVEGHLSDMRVGPAAYTAQALEGEKDAVWRPTGYDSGRLPFDNKGGIDELINRVGSTRFDDGNGIIWEFPEEVPWDIIGFSQGAIIVCRFLLEHVIPENGILHWRWKSFNKGMCFGNPYRYMDECAEWVPDKPALGTQGIADVHLNARQIFLPSGKPLSERWREVTRKGDLYGENEVNGEVGLNKTSIYKIVSENSWSGGPAGMLARVLDLLINPVDGVIDIARAIIEGIIGATRLDKHNIHDLGPCINWMRGIAA